MQLSHINVTMPLGCEDIARSFYSDLLGLSEIPKPEPLRVRGGVWFDAGGLDIHLSVEDRRGGPDAYRHFGLECPDVDGLRARLWAAGVGHRRWPASAVETFLRARPVRQSNRDS
jgi:hypothetical protein